MNIITSLFLLTHPPTTEIYTLSLHDALPISLVGGNIAFVNSANVTTYTVQPNFEYAFRLSFQLHAQIHQAQKPTLSSSGYANAFSWNARFGANDLSNDINYTSKDPTAGTFYEFGVYQY